MSNNGQIILSSLALVLVLSIRDLYYNTANADIDDNSDKKLDQKTRTKSDRIDEFESSGIVDNEKEVEVKLHKPSTADRYSNYEPKFKARFSGPRLNFLYCFSCGYKQAFDEFSKIIAERYPSIKIEGANYAPPYLRALAAQLLTYAKIALIAAIFLGANPFPMNQDAEASMAPSVYQWALNNKLYACTMIFFLTNAVETYLTSTGAFEIAYNDVPIWSKLEVGRMPSPQELVQIIDSHNRLSASSHTNFRYY